jgi:hypothetical protein
VARGQTALWVLCLAGLACSEVRYDLELTVDPASVEAVSFAGESVSESPFRYGREFSSGTEAYEWPGLEVLLTPTMGEAPRTFTVRLACKAYVGDTLSAEVDVLRVRVEFAPSVDVVVTGGGRCEGDETVPWALE